MKKSVAELLNGLSIIFALVSGLSWHLSTVGADVSALAAITSQWNTIAAIFASISALLAFIGLFFKK